MDNICRKRQRIHKHGPECGWYGLNQISYVCAVYRKEFERFYEDAENGIFELEEWHDSYVSPSIPDPNEKY